MVQCLSFNCQIKDIAKLKFRHKNIKREVKKQFLVTRGYEPYPTNHEVQGI